MTTYTYSTTYMKKINSLLVTGSNLGFMSPWPLLNVWKFIGKLRKMYWRLQNPTFQKVSKIFENLRKSLN